MIFKYEDKDFALMDTVHDIFLSLSISGKDKLRVIHCSDVNIINDLRAVRMYTFTAINNIYNDIS